MRSWHSALHSQQAGRQESSRSHQTWSPRSRSWRTRQSWSGWRCPRAAWSRSPSPWRPQRASTRARSSRRPWMAQFRKAPCGQNPPRSARRWRPSRGRAEEGRRRLLGWTPLTVPTPVALKTRTARGGCTTRRWTMRAGPARRWRPPPRGRTRWTGPWEAVGGTRPQRTWPCVRRGPRGGRWQCRLTSVGRPSCPRSIAAHSSRRGICRLQRCSGSSRGRAHSRCRSRHCSEPRRDPWLGS